MKRIGAVIMSGVELGIILAIAPFVSDFITEKLIPYVVTKGNEIKSEMMS